MKTLAGTVTVAVTALLLAVGSIGACPAWAEGPFVRLAPIPAPRVVACCEEYPGGAFRVGHLVDDRPGTEFASNGKGVGTFVEFDLGKSRRVGAFRHVDRNDPANVAESRLTFIDESGKPVGEASVTHAARRSGVTLIVLPKPVNARRVRWEVTKTADAATCSGGAEVGFFETTGSEAVPRGIGVLTRAEPVVETHEGRASQPVTVVLDFPYGAPADVLIRVEGQPDRPARLTFGRHSFRFSLPTIASPRSLKVAVVRDGQTLAEQTTTVAPARPMTVYLLPHSHVDIGYTHRQADVMKRQWQNIETALDLASKTADYPAGARFKWNTEVLWAVDAYLQQAPPEKRARLVAAIKSGRVGLDALYGNELTGLCRPEELMRLLQWGISIGRRCGVTVESAMISDVPGLTWGTVPACAQAGVRYFSLGINYIDGGRTLPAWEDRPFYWVGPDGRDRVLCWLPYKGYALGHTGYRLNEQLPDRLRELEAMGYPYDVVQLRWNIGGDNGPPDATLPDVVRRWNETHVTPRLVIATTPEVFRALEARHAAQIPSARGDFTPYWENGAGSTARETALNRNAAERLVQAETLAALLAPRAIPASDFNAAWRDAILYDEHTWGAHNSIDAPDDPFVKDQWRVKQAFALDADRRSRELLSSVFAARGGTPEAGAADVFNTSSWPRSELVVLDRSQSSSGDRVTDAAGRAVPSQRLTTGELAFLAADVPALAGRRYRVGPGKGPDAGYAAARGLRLTTPSLTVAVDPRTGAIAELRSAAAGGELSDTRNGIGLNHFAYVRGDRVREPIPAGPPAVRVKEAGPLVASLVVESDAPGCARLTREVRVVDGIDRVDVVNVIDKTAVRTKEAIHLGYAFLVPGGVLRVEVPWAVMRPEADQIPGSCKNWLSVNRWADVSNAERGVTWATLDAPVIEAGGITADKLGSTPAFDAWQSRIEPTQTVYAYAMNNHWHTNYKADQDGPTAFRFGLMPHRAYDPVAAHRFGIACGQPLVVTPARGPEPSGTPGLEADDPAAIVESVKPSEDRAAWVVRLQNVAERPVRTGLRFGRITPAAVWLSNLAEDRLARLNGPLEIPAGGVVTVRADLIAPDASRR